MHNHLEFVFKTRDIKELVEQETEYIVIRSFLEGVVLKDGSKAGAVRVYADAVKKGKEAAVLSVPGCPNPPCRIDDDLRRIEP